MIRTRRPIPVATVLYFGLWVPAILLAGFISFIGYIGTGFGGLWLGLCFLLALPITLLGIWSFQISALAMIVAFVWDIVATTWPHISVSGFMGSQIDVMLLANTIGLIVIAVLSPFKSIVSFIRYMKEN